MSSLISSFIYICQLINLIIMRVSKYFMCSKPGDQLKDKICNSCLLKNLENKVVCGLCKTVRDVKPFEYLRTLNYFKLFDMKEEFKINKHKLEAQYKELQKIVHPDKYAISGEVKFYIIYKGSPKRSTELLCLD
jgi:hypothetical protein